ncbi:unnamed protein product [Cladocopium goreaui]|uniref:Uncharacterized protein n=1 Tax=Cladocopium goreaui TaxID=2562237 RepID=A0A9P1C9Y1_9DINO|nr:unnamed protein product [Cladocopium goreaui]
MTKNEYDVLELYAGQQRLVKLAKGLKMKTAAMDRDFDTLGDNKSKNNAMDMNTSGGFVLSCVMVLRAKWGAFLGLLGVVCSTFVRQVWKDPLQGGWICTQRDTVDEEPSVLELLLSMPTGDCWDDAELWTVYEYCRGSRHLQLPPAYRAVLFQLEGSNRAMSEMPDPDPEAMQAELERLEALERQMREAQEAQAGQDEVPPSPPPPRAAAELGSGGAGPTEFANPEDETQPGQLHGVESLDESRKSHMMGEQSVDEHAAPSPMQPATPPGHLEKILRTPPSQVDGVGCLNARDDGNPNFKRPAGDVDDPELYVAMSVPPEVLSEKAIYMRINRVFKRRQDGTYILDDKWNKAWSDVDGGGRDEIYSMFEKVGYQRDRFIKRCKAITERISEESSEIEGEWLTVGDMQKMEFSETKIKGVMRYCETRLSKYGEGMMYWTEIRSRGKTKRHISKEISEWEEEVGKDCGHDVPTDAPELEWGFMEGNKQEQTPAAPGLLLDKATEEADTALVQVESEDVKREMDKLQFPQVEGDTAPSALVPKACGSIQKQVGKLEAMMETCKSVGRLTPLQERILDTKLFFGWDMEDPMIKLENNH